MADQGEEEDYSKVKLKCVVCEKGDSKQYRIVKHNLKENVEHFKQCVYKRVELGDLDRVPLKKRLESIDDWKSIRYHSQCKKTLCNTVHIERLLKRSQSAQNEDDLNIISPSKRGRPSQTTTTRNQRPSKKTVAKQKICMFYDCEFCKSESAVNLHQVMSCGRGLQLLNIKERTQNDQVRVAVSGLETELDAQAQEKWYHDKCMRRAERTCTSPMNENSEMLYRHLSDFEIVAYVKESLRTKEVLTMNDINDMYAESLVERGFVSGSSDHKKHLKSVLIQHIPGIEFRQPSCRNKSATVHLQSVISEMIDSLITSNFESPAMFNLCKLLRYEILQYRDWHFTGDFSTLREDRKLLSKILITAQKRPDLLSKMEDIVKMYEMSVIPRANFSPDGAMLLTTDKSSLMKLVIGQTPLQVQIPLPESRPQVLIIDAMPEVKCLKKRATTTRLVHLKEMFLQRIRRKAAKGQYKEIFIAFDEWRDESLKEKTRAKRGQQPDGNGFDMHDSMCLKKTSIAELLATNTSKTQMAAYLAKGLLEEYSENSDVRLVVTHSGNISINKPHTLPHDFSTHNHEEADTQIPLLLLHSLCSSTYKHFDVYSPDTDVLILLMDLVSRGNTGALTNIIMHAGKESAPKSIDIMDRVKVIGTEKSQAMIGLHAYTGEDHGNKFVGITKNAWCKIFFDTLDSGDPIVEAFCNLGSFTSDQCALDTDGGFNEVVKPIERFTCIGYDNSGPYTVPELRWKLYSTKNKEAENLPPCRATLSPLINRTNYISMVYKSYSHTHPVMPELSNSGWTRDQTTNALLPVYCLLPPAPDAILELVKCGCKKGDCSKNVCICYKNNVPCISLCKCSDECSNSH